MSGFLQIVLFCSCELDRLDALYRTTELQDRSIVSVSIPIVARMDKATGNRPELAPVLVQGRPPHHHLQLIRLRIDQAMGSGQDTVLVYQGAAEKQFIECVSC